MVMYSFSLPRVTCCVLCARDIQFCTKTGETRLVRYEDSWFDTFGAWPLVLGWKLYEDAGVAMFWLLPTGG